MRTRSAGDARSGGRVGSAGEAGKSVSVGAWIGTVRRLRRRSRRVGEGWFVGGFQCEHLRGRGGAAAQLAVAAAFTVAWLAPNSTKSAVANGDTRTILLSSQHTNETGSFTFMVNGVYDQAVLDKLNWFCRDWRLNEPTKMDPHLFDIIWEVYRESGLDAADRRPVRLPLAADQRDAAPAVAPGRRAFAAHARQGDRRAFRRRQHRRASATSPCGCRRAASASIRPA